MMDSNARSEKHSGDIPSCRWNRCPKSSLHRISARMMRARLVRQVLCGMGLALLIVLARPLAVRAQSSICEMGNPNVEPGLSASAHDGGLTVLWDGDKGSEQVRLRFSITAGTPTIEELAVRRRGERWSVVARGLTPEFRVTSGIRRITDQQLEPLRQLGVEITPELVDREKWKAFWDAPLRVGPESVESPRAPVDGIAGQPGLPRDPDEITRTSADFQAAGCTVKRDGLRLEVSFPGVEAGPFSGELRYTVFKGTNLILQELIAETEEPSVAYKYDAGLEGLEIRPRSRMVWQDIAGGWQDYRFGGPANDGSVSLRTSRRILSYENDGGAISVFPPPHNFFWAREITTNLGYNWYRHDADSTFAFGIRQAEREEHPDQAGRGPTDFRDNFALYNARPGTEQRMSVFFYVSPGAASDAIRSGLEFTRSDRFKELPGYEVMASHVHGYFVRRLQRLGHTVDTEPADFEAVQAAGIDIFAPIDGGAGGLGCCPSSEDYVENLATFYEIARRHSDSDFLVLPSVEFTPGELPSLVRHTGGHWDLLFSRPVLFSAGREPNEPLAEADERLGTVYNLGSAEDVMEMMHREDVLAYMAHPRSKGSTGYPDAIKDTDRFRDESFRGIGFRWGMGLDRSAERLCARRCLKTLDDMNNWLADTDEPTPPKFLHAISEVYQQGPGDDIYANNPVNYVRLDEVPGPDDWRPLIDAMKRGDYFVTSGEIVIPEYQVRGGEGSNRIIVADVEWTFPLEFVEVVWGDGKEVGRTVVSATHLPPFGAYRFEIPFDATGKKWVRFAAWDVAGNGALVQPVELSGNPAP